MSGLAGVGGVASHLRSQHGHSLTARGLAVRRGGDAAGQGPLSRATRPLPRTSRTSEPAAPSRTGPNNPEPLGTAIVAHRKKRRNLRFACIVFWLDGAAGASIARQDGSRRRCRLGIRMPFYEALYGSGAYVFRPLGDDGRRHEAHYDAATGLRAGRSPPSRDNKKKRRRENKREGSAGPACKAKARRAKGRGEAQGAATRSPRPAAIWPRCGIFQRFPATK
jgi:hypothetical protein